MAKISKEFDLYAWRNNNINIIAVSNEHNGKEIVFNLYTDSKQNKVLNSTSKNYIPHLYVGLPNNKSTYVVGTLDKINSKVTFTLESRILTSCGRFNCFVSLIANDTVIKFAGVTLCVLNGDIKDYVDGISQLDSYTQLTLNVSYLMSKINNVVSEFDVSNIEALSTYPNVSNSCVKSTSNFKSTNNWTVNNGGELTVKDSCLTVKNTQTTDLLGELSKEKEINNTAMMLVKVRVKMLEGSYVCVYPIYSTVDNTTIAVTDNILASNLRPISNDFLITDNKWHNIWFIFDCSDNHKIKSAGIRISSSPNVTISNFNAFYSLDKCSNGGLEVIDKRVEINMIKPYSKVATSNITFNNISFTEGEI